MLKFWAISAMMLSVFISPGVALAAACPPLNRGASADALIDCLNRIQVELDRMKEDLHFIENRSEKLFFEVLRKSELPSGVQIDNVALPRGAVVAFDRASCPDGWVPFRDADGRMILGAMDNGDPDFVWHEKGGEKNVTLSLSQMPRHRHHIFSNNNSRGPGGLSAGSAVQSVGTGGNLGQHEYAMRGTSTPGEPDVGVASEAGGSEPHNNMPPYIALYFCKKD